MLDLPRYWYQQATHPLMLGLLPLSWLFRGIVALRRWSFRVGLCRIYTPSVPVIVVGNITVGGTGKTPFVIWLAQQLQACGLRPGIVSRGVGGKRHRRPHQVSVTDTAALVGDEALLMHEQTACPVVIGIDRAAAVSHLLATSACDVIISDDGLQHYKLGRAMEIVMIDHTRQLGNQHLLPAGPLREPIKRLREVDHVIKHGEGDFYVTPERIVNLCESSRSYALHEFPQRMIHAVAGIGHPQRFFAALRAQGFVVIEHVFADHHAYVPHDLQFNDDYPIVMTEKDAVKCRTFKQPHFWATTVNIRVNPVIEAQLLRQIMSLTQGASHPTSSS